LRICGKKQFSSLLIQFRISINNCAELGFNNAAPNNGMHPTANSLAFMRETPAIQRLVAAGDAGRYASSCDVTLNVFGCTE